MMKLGFIDYFLDEWHANQYVKWIHDPSRNKRFEITYAWAAIDKEGGLSTPEWCKTNHVREASSIEELIEQCDGLLVLSPDNPEQHMALSSAALVSGKPTYIDKTFAPDYATAIQMFDIAKKHGTPIFSTSALRYALEILQYTGPGSFPADMEMISARGPGKFANYSVHQLEMVVRTMGIGARRAMAVVTGNAPMVVYDYGDGRRSTIHCMPWADFSLAVQTKQGEGVQLDIQKDFWPGFIDELLEFFDTKNPPVSALETCEVIAMVEAGLKAIERPDQWISLTSV